MAWFVFPNATKPGDRAVTCPLDESSFQKAVSDFVVIDIETTGLSLNTDEIIQMSAIRFINFVEVDHFSTYVHPSVHIPSGITKMTGISDADVCSAPLFSDIWVQYKDFIEAAPVITGYNVSFDLQFLSKASGEDLRTKWKCFDTLACVKQAFSSLENYKLSTVCDFIHYSDRFHDSLNDCRACGEVIKYLACTDCDELISLRYLKSPAKYRNHAHALKIDEYKKNLCRADSPPIELDQITNNGPLSGKNIVFTGTLSFGRSSAFAMAEAAGAFVKSSVSKKTNYLVVGAQDISIVGSDGLSTKTERAYQLIDEYGINIKIIGEAEFLQLLIVKEGASING